MNVDQKTRDRIKAHARELAAQAPPLSPEIRDRLRTILRGDRKAPAA